MVSWSFYNISEVVPEWNKLVVDCLNHNIFQTRNWAEFKSQQGWEPLFCVAKSKEDHLMALSLILIKPLGFKYSFAWSPGGILCYPQESQVVDLEKLFEGLQSSFGNDHRKSILRMNFLHEHNSLWAHDLSKSFSRPLKPINSGFTNIISIQKDVASFMDGMTSKHRYYTKKALKTPLTWKAYSGQFAFNEFYEVYDRMLNEKSLEHLRIMAKDSLQMIQCFPENHFFVTGYFNNKPVTSCLILTLNKKAHYYLAATCQEGRKHSASYAMVYKLYEYLMENSFSELDFGGIAPANKDAQGVDHFKNGFGGRVIEYLGEWESSRSKWLRYLVNFILQYKK